MDLLICAVSNNNLPSFVDYQYECFKKYVKGKFEYILFDNSDNPSEFKRHCDYIGAFYVKVQKDITGKELSNFILNNVYNLMKFRGVMMICNLDVFLVDNFDPLNKVINADIISVNDRTNIFVENDLVVVNLNKLQSFTDNINDMRPSILLEYIKKSKELVFKQFSINVADDFKVYDNLFLKHSIDSKVSNDDLFGVLCNKLIDWQIVPDSSNKYIISFSLYGDNPRYTYNAVMNALIAQKVYKGWICRFYYDNTVPLNIINILDTLDNTELIKMETENNAPGAEKMFWRFYPASESDVAVMLVRDSDAWLSFREAFQVKKWVESNKVFHIIRDHCHHTSKVMGGMWGVKRGRLNNLKDLAKIQANNRKSYGDDQAFLESVIYPLIVDSAMIHFTAGIKNDNMIKIEGFQDYPRVLECIPGIDIERTNDTNSFSCTKCQKVHPFFIGIQLFTLHESTKALLSKYGL